MLQAILCYGYAQVADISPGSRFFSFLAEFLLEAPKPVFLWEKKSFLLMINKGNLLDITNIF